MLESATASKCEVVPDQGRSEPILEEPQKWRTTQTATKWSSSLDIVLANDDEANGISTTCRSISEECRTSLENFLRNDTSLPMLAVALEASSHPTGLVSLQAQPWRYAGGGLGNREECLAIRQTTHDFSHMQNCVAGMNRHRAASLPFARLCIPASCTASDLVGKDMLPFLHNLLNRSNLGSHESRCDFPINEQSKLAEEYVTLVERMLRINRFLGSGWVCGEYEAAWQWEFTGPFLSLTVLLTLIAGRATARKWGYTMSWRYSRFVVVKSETQSYERESMAVTVDNNNDVSCQFDQRTSPTFTSSCSESCSSVSNTSPQESEDDDDTDTTASTTIPCWSEAFDVHANLKHLMIPSGGFGSSTTCLDGIRVASLLWIVLGHLMAIGSSSGPGYSNPASFLPPDGWTASVGGQLLFSSRLAVDTFFCISGFLLVHVLEEKLCRTGWTLPGIIISRVLRVLPLYAYTLTFYLLIAPHLGSGPFWYQWQDLLERCANGAWISNVLFVNNLTTGGIPVSDTCFYHSWYLAVDMQLFLVMAMLLIASQRFSSVNRYSVLKIAVLILFASSVATTTFLSWVRHWSSNTFDGQSVARYDIEAYAQPYIRAQSYLAGMYAALMIRQGTIQIEESYRVFYFRAAFASIIFVTFVTASGAYAQRPCLYHELPGPNRCGSTWSPVLTFSYTAFSRTIWSIAVSTIVYLCIDKRKRQLFQCDSHEGDVRFAESSGISIVERVLSWQCWVPLSHLSFGMYLIHPVVILVWQLGSADKVVFRLTTFAFLYVEVCVASYAAALILFLLIEQPLATLWKSTTQRMTQKLRLGSDSHSDRQHLLSGLPVSANYQSTCKPAMIP